MMKEFYVIVDGQQQGPFSIEQLAEMAITPETEVWTTGMSDWQQAGDVPDLTSLLQQQQFQHHMEHASVTPPPYASRAHEASAAQAAPEPQAWSASQAQAPEEPVKQRKQNNGCGMKLLLATLILVIMGGVLAVTCPSRQEHKDAISQSTNQWIDEKMKAVDDRWGGLTTVLTGAVEWVSGQGIDFVVDRYLDVDNYGVCSVGRINLGEKQRVVSVGILNHVFTFDKEDVDQFLLKTLKEKMGISDSPNATRHDNPTITEEPATDEDDSYLASPEEQDSVLEATRPSNPAEELLDSLAVHAKRQAIKTAKEWAKKQIDKIGN